MRPYSSKDCHVSASPMAQDEMIFQQMLYASRSRPDDL
ncbi:hypothetical protein HMPREF0010_01473 [Acinetobacter baumannii ATCC 19606 = CIP 70.34 = JCM 6841]|uniref:Uncharacterized protein n=1 Tax=Acinetobacter baumannii (strain ATCC 19606 / DSM 30007 / JCM 6841 / CCUG 19606 / CIP 70.34 / NBRC 109757 / NCIMB 12457 / NCTC 12156 / 81) TaxID=575584 RepID=D0CA10_ACIB2|nr:hypothetical protein A1S_3581 [Acinetobacter baumannii ATCC 17978]EEX04079.1 hypothetical protein HMPREF0010_01473 [Acinetobacter baumannii ATCC 19606 = CIP 70.34 = JCM 6841]